MMENLLNIWMSLTRDQNYSKWNCDFTGEMLAGTMGPRGRRSRQEKT